MNWLGASIEEDAFGSMMTAAGITVDTIKQWSVDPQVCIPAKALRSPSSVCHPTTQPPRAFAVLLYACAPTTLILLLHAPHPSQNRPARPLCVYASVRLCPKRLALPPPGASLPLRVSASGPLTGRLLLCDVDTTPPARR